MSPVRFKVSPSSLALAGIAALALLLRLLGAEQVFRSADVIFRGYDSYYHARRALHSLLHFPAVLERDSLLNYPYGSAVPWPPLYDASIAAIAKLLGGDEATLELVAALLPALLGTLAVIPVFLVGRRLGGRAAGLLAALLLACFEAHVGFSRVGFADHHAASALLGMLLLAAALRIADRREIAPARAWIGLSAVRVALVLAIPGSVILLVAPEAGLLLVTASEPDAGRRARLRRGGTASALASAALLLPFAWVAATTADYGVNPNYFTTFHPLFFGCIAALNFALGAFERGAGAGSATRRIGTLLACGGGLALLGVAASADLRGGLEYGLRFLSGTHAAGDRVIEERALLAFRGEADASYALRLFGLGLLLLPLVPVQLARALRDAARRPPLGLFAAQFLFFGLLALSAVRFANEFAGAAAVGLALLAAGAGRALSRRFPTWPRSARVALGIAALALLLFPVARVHAGRALQLGRVLSGEPPRASLEASMFRFAQRVRALTPETRGFLDASEQPEYAIFAWSGIGHHLHYVARRATVADNFGPVTGLDDENFRLSDQLFRYRVPARALRTLRRLGAPYLLTTDFGWKDPDVFLNRMHRDDGSAREDRNAIARLRLLTESQARGPNGSRFKLFELVKGALLVVDAAPGAPVEARVVVRTNTGRRFVWSNRAIAGDDGRARLRVPYATGRSLAPTRAAGPLEVWVGAALRSVEVRESDVREGRAIEVSADADEPLSEFGQLP